MTVSVRSARPSLWYCLMRERLSTSVTSTSPVSGSLNVSVTCTCSSKSPSPFLSPGFFERTATGVRLTALGAALVAPAKRVLREIETAQGRIDAARAGRTGRFRVTANPTWEVVLAHAIARFHERFPAVELYLETATRVEGLHLLAEGRSDLHCGGIDSGEALPTYLRRERFLDMTAGIVASRGHPLLGREITDDDLARSPWIDYDAAAMAAPGERRPSLTDLLERLYQSTRTRVQTIVRTGSAGLFLNGERPLSRLALAHAEGHPPQRLVEPQHRTGPRVPLAVRTDALGRTGHVGLTVLAQLYVIARCPGNRIPAHLHLGPRRHPRRTQHAGARRRPRGTLASRGHAPAGAARVAAASASGIQRSMAPHITDITGGIGENPQRFALPHPATADRS